MVKKLRRTQNAGKYGHFHRLRVSHLRRLISPLATGNWPISAPNMLFLIVTICGLLNQRQQQITYVYGGEKVWLHGGDAQFVPHPSALTGTAYLNSSLSSLLSFRQSHGAMMRHKETGMKYGFFGSDRLHAACSLIFCG
jgi:hypothetical protein